MNAREEKKKLRFLPDVPRPSRLVDAFSAAERYGLPAVIGPEKSSLVDSRGRAYDSAGTGYAGCADVQGFLRQTGVMEGTPFFIGYASCANLSQDGMIRAGVETLASEITREWLEIDCRDPERGEAVTRAVKEFKLRRLFRRAAGVVGYFGVARVFIDTGTRDPEILITPLTLTPETFAQGSLRGFIPIDPALMFPGAYNAADPVSPWFYKPQTWFALGREIHSTRFLHFVQNDPEAVLLKPVYNFGGIPQSQIALDYLVHFTGTRESAARLLSKFSLTVLKTDMNAVIYGEEADDSNLARRVKYMARYRDNDGVQLVDNESEDIAQINTPLSGVTDIVRQALEMLAAVWRMPVTKYLGVSPAGMNATGESDMNNWYDYAGGQQAAIYDNPLEVCLKLLQLHSLGSVDPGLTHVWRPLRKLTEKERAEIGKLQADRDGVLLQNQVISQEEARARLAADAESDYAGLDPDKAPEGPEGPEGPEDAGGLEDLGVEP